LKYTFICLLIFTHLIDLAANDTLCFCDSTLFQKQLKPYGHETLKKKGLNGEGVKVLVIDMGFNGADKNPYLSHLFDDNQIIAHRDFNTKKGIDFTTGIDHGTAVLFFMAGELNDIQTGLAPKAQYALANLGKVNSVTDVMKEWIRIIDWADSLGIDIIQTSVGTSYDIHSIKGYRKYDNVLRKAANLAARKNMLLISALSNQSWFFRTSFVFPSFADSVLSVGALNNFNGTAAEYTSLGPNYDLSLKPEISAVGDLHWYNVKMKATEFIQGTSFSAPLVSGFAACIYQNDTSLTAMELKDTIVKSSSLHPYYDYSHGHGLPFAEKYFGNDIYKRDSTFSIKIRNDTVYIVPHHDYKGETFYYHIQSREGHIKEYYVFEAHQNDDGENEFYIVEKNHKQGDLLRVFHRSYMIEIKLNRE
jgi:serine protease AprX